MVNKNILRLDISMPFYALEHSLDRVVNFLAYVPFLLKHTQINA